MGIRETMNRYPQATAVVAAVIAVLAIGMLTLRGRGDTEQYQYSYYMMPQSGQVMVDVAGQIPPLANGAVRAVVFSCSDCSDKSTHQIGWLVTYTDKAKAAMGQMQNTAGSEDPAQAPMTRDAVMAVEQGRLIALPTDGTAAPRWYPAVSAEGMAVMRAARSKCGDSPQMCSPLPSERP
jgi:hypothetical protein